MTGRKDSPGTTSGIIREDAEGDRSGGAGEVRWGVRTVRDDTINLLVAASPEGAWHGWDERSRE